MAARFALSRIAHVILFVKDMGRAVAFYRDALGLSVRSESPEWSELETEGVMLALHLTTEDVPFHHPALPEVAFEAEDVRQAHAVLKDRRVKIHDLRQVCAHGDRVGLSAEMHDPDGNRLSLYGLVPASDWTAA